MKKILLNLPITMLIIGILGMSYSIIAGIWGYAPIEKFNLKIFGTAIVIIFLAIAVNSITEEMSD